jgi:hypothetical protein
MPNRRAEVTGQKARAGWDEMGENLKQEILCMIVSRPLNPREFVALAALIGLLLGNVLS